jgi:hypothetical protein
MHQPCPGGLCSVVSDTTPTVIDRVRHGSVSAHMLQSLGKAWLPEAWWVCKHMHHERRVGGVVMMD